MKVYHITNDIAQASGVGTFVRHINDELNAQGVESHVLTEVPETLEDSFLPDIVHIHGMWLGLHHAALRWAKLAGAKVVWSTHGMTAPWAMHHKWWKKLPAWLLYQKHDLKQADLIHCTTDLEVSWNHNLGLKNTFIAPLGTTLPTKKEDANSTVRLRPSPSPTQRTLLFVGRVYPVKALDRLITAFQMVPHDGWRLRIVGPDEAGHLAELQKIAGPDVDFPGPKFGQELEQEYESCTALALVSHTENFGATVVDAMAHAKPVITSTHTPWKVVADRQCGFWVDNDPETLSKAIARLFKCSDNQLNQMGVNGLSLVKGQFSWHSIAKKLISNYELVLQGV